MTILELMRSDAYITVNKKLAKAVGLHEAIIYGELVSRYFYFTNHDKLTDDGYFFNTVEDLEEATTLSEKQQRRAIKMLEHFQLIEIDVRGLPAKRYFRINENTGTLIRLLNAGREILTKSQLRQNGGTSSAKRAELERQKGRGNNTKQIIQRNKKAVVDVLHPREGSENLKGASAEQELVKHYLNHIHPGAHGLEIEKLCGWLDAFPGEVIMMAIDRAVLQNKRSYAYLEAILRGWDRDGLTTVSLVEGHLKQWQDKKQQPIKKSPLDTGYVNLADLINKEDKKEQDAKPKSPLDTGYVNVVDLIKKGVI